MLQSPWPAPRDGPRSSTCATRDPRAPRGRGTAQGGRARRGGDPDRAGGQAVPRPDGLRPALTTLDGTAKLSRLGGNTICGISLAFARAQATAQGAPLFRHFAEMVGKAPVARLPLPIVSLFSGDGGDPDRSRAAGSGFPAHRRHHRRRGRRPVGRAGGHRRGDGAGPLRHGRRHVERRRHPRALLRHRLDAGPRPQDGAERGARARPRHPAGAAGGGEPAVREGAGTASTARS